MGSANLPTKLLDGLIEVNKAVVATDENQITFTNKKRKLKPMREVAGEFGFEIKNVVVAEEIEQPYGKGTRTIKIFQADVLSLDDEETAELTVEEEVEEEEFEPVKIKETIDEAIEDIHAEVLDEDLLGELGEAINELGNEAEFKGIDFKGLQDPPKFEISTSEESQVVIQRASEVEPDFDTKWKGDWPRVHCGKCGYTSMYYTREDIAKRIAENHKC